MKDAVMPMRIHPPLQSIRLLPGTPFYDGQQNMMKYLAEQDVDTLLYNFRKEAGLPLGDAEPMTGWDAEDCKLKGHTTGHYLSAASLAYAAGGGEGFRQKVCALAEGLLECQSALSASGRVHPGFLSAYDEAQFDLLEKLTPYPEIWAPYYTLDKIMAGLLDAYELAGVSAAREILVPLGSWIYERLSRVPRARRNEMWDTYIAGEFGAMTGTLVRLYRLSGKREHLEAARMFDNPRLFDQMREGHDQLDAMHANQHIPQIIGALELYAATGQRDYLTIARSFERFVTAHHCYAIGGTGEEERFRASDRECSYLTEKTAESCASVNMLRLTSRLVELDESAGCDLMDYYENTLFNHILMSYSHAADGGTTYFMPLAPGSSKHYETWENSCCHGTGMESRFRYMRDIYSYEGTGEDRVLRVDLPISSIFGEENVMVELSETGRLEIRALSDMKVPLKVRIPAWARDHFPEAEGGYVSCGKLKKGESAAFELPMEIRAVPRDSDPDFYNLAAGPYLLAALSDQKEYLHPDVEGTTKTEDGHPGTHRCGDILLKPLYMVDDENYHIYFKRFEEN